MVLIDSYLEKYRQKQESDYHKKTRGYSLSLVKKKGKGRNRHPEELLKY